MQQSEALNGSNSSSSRQPKLAVNRRGLGQVAFKPKQLVFIDSVKSVCTKPRPLPPYKSIIIYGLASNIRHIISHWAAVDVNKMPNHMTTSGFHVSQLRAEQTATTTVRHMFTRGRGKEEREWMAVVVVTLTKYCHYYYYGQWAVRCPCVCDRVCVRCGLELSGENQNKWRRSTTIVICYPIIPGQARNWPAVDGAACWQH